MKLHLEKIVPLVCLIVAGFTLTPIGRGSLSLNTIVLVHVISYLALGLCFELPELSLNSVCLFWARREEDSERHIFVIKKILKIRYVLTHFVGPTTGIMAVASGLYLTQRTGHSFQEGWLFWILIAAIIGLYKGMSQHNRYIKHLLSVSEDISQPSRQLRFYLRSPLDQFLIFLELPTYLFIYWTASVKPAWMQNPLAGMIGQLEQMGSVWTTGIVILIVGAVILIPLQWVGRRV